MVRAASSQLEVSGSLRILPNAMIRNRVRTTTIPRTKPAQLQHTPTAPQTSPTTPQPTATSSRTAPTQHCSTRRPRQIFRWSPSPYRFMARMCLGIRQRRVRAGRPKVTKVGCSITRCTMQLAMSMVRRWQQVPRARLGETPAVITRSSSLGVRGRASWLRHISSKFRGRGTPLWWRSSTMPSIRKSKR